MEGVLIMIKKTLTILLLSLSFACLLTGCKKQEKEEDTTTSEVTTEAPTTEDGTDTADPATEEDTEAVDDEDVDAVDENGDPVENTETEPTTATKDDEKNVKTFSGTFNGLADSTSCEIELDDGSYMILMIKDDDLYDELDKLEPGTSITFTCSPLAGQANYQILSIQ